MSEASADVEIHRPDKLLIPGEPGLTKAGLAEHYERVADLMLPHLDGRPVSLQRFPDGIEEGGFYQKSVPDHFPDFVTTAEVETSDGLQRQVVIDSLRTLLYLVDQACLLPHTWLSRVPHLRRPDQLVVDVDPSVEDLSAVRRATRLVGELLDELGLTSFLKTTGSRGYHVVVPLVPDDDVDRVRAVAGRLAAHLAAREPDLLTVEARKKNRGDRVYLDVARNAYAQTAVPPYAVRARPGAPVATPIRWDELSRIEPDGHTVASLPRRLARIQDPWADMAEQAQPLGPAVERLDRLD